MLPGVFNREFGLLKMKVYFHSVVKKHIPTHSVNLRLECFPELYMIAMISRII